MALDETTEELAHAAARGDHRSLGELLRRVEPDVLRHCGRLLPYHQDAEEACQDTLLAVARNIGRFEGRARFSTWLHIVTTNCARTTYRTLKRRSAEQADEHLPELRADPRRVSVIAGSRLDLLDAMEALESQRPDLAQALVLRDICELDYNEVAEQLGIPLGTVKSRIHQARKYIKAALGDAYDLRA
ncbi:sigma-70 family RNA polymerase sigma factor [Sphaerisporangium sp. TRM90804]|uniref:RNA polymerase sigma factor n=1 Tax=Sphaerisporangium sp. TRM90804 TaxID=3031113 RepID=UPI002448D7D8|nr:sigma-70 family RNA polymerase sigma factor [Sphaerisporangium sp. TRM90804]MDH2430424.1 sigma-70 family RNA polymerase sigma factor [Sphaerisporangium sp. TRM90804]